MIHLSSIIFFNNVNIYEIPSLFQDKTIYCPVSGKPLRAKDLINIKFIEVKDPDDKKALITKENRYMCAVTHDILSNAVPCAVIKTR